MWLWRRSWKEPREHTVSIFLRHVFSSIYLSMSLYLSIFVLLGLLVLHNADIWIETRRSRSDTLHSIVAFRFFFHDLKVIEREMRILRGQGIPDREIRGALCDRPTRLQEANHFGETMARINGLGNFSQSISNFGAKRKNGIKTKRKF